MQKDVSIYRKPTNTLYDFSTHIVSSIINSIIKDYESRIMNQGTMWILNRTKYSWAYDIYIYNATNVYFENNEWFWTLKLSQLNSRRDLRYGLFVIFSATEILDKFCKICTFIACVLWNFWKGSLNKISRAGEGSKKILYSKELSQINFNLEIIKKKLTAKATIAPSPASNLPQKQLLPLPHHSVNLT